jgi:hypothetical protein
VELEPNIEEPSPVKRLQWSLFNAPNVKWGAIKGPEGAKVLSKNIPLLISIPRWNNNYRDQMLIIGIIKQTGQIYGTASLYKQFGILHIPHLANYEKY